MTTSESAANRATASLPKKLPLLALAGLAVLYLVTVLPSLGNDPIVGGDEGWIISASAKLADEGVFGSDLFRGFYGAEDHYYFNLPLHHLVLATVFKLAGVGVTQARLVSMFFGLAALLLTYALGRRIGGEAVGLVAASLVVLLRLNLTPFTGLTLTDLGATVRYDLIAVPYGLAAALLLLKRPVTPSIALVAGAGLLLGLGALTQFIGAMFALPFALWLLTAALPWKRRLLLTAVLGATAALVFLPYLVYVGANPTDFGGQSRSVEQDTSFTSPAFYLRQLRHEPSRFAGATQLHGFPASLHDLAQRPSSRLALLVAGPISALWVLRRWREPEYRLLGLMLVCLVVELALFESTKRFVYWVVAVPVLCLCIADMGVGAWLWARERLEQPSSRAVEQGARAGATFLPYGMLAAIVLVATLFALEGLGVAAKDVRDARNPSDYGALVMRLDAALSPGASALGDNRLWPALRHRDFRSLILVFYHTNPRISEERTTDVFGALERTGADYILLSPLSRDILTRLTPRDAADFQRFLDTRTDLVTTVPDKAYGPIDVYRVKN